MGLTFDFGESNERCSTDDNLSTKQTCPHQGFNCAVSLKLLVVVPHIHAAAEAAVHLQHALLFCTTHRGVACSMRELPPSEQGV